MRQISDEDEDHDSRAGRGRGTSIDERSGGEMCTNNDHADGRPRGDHDSRSRPTETIARFTGGPGGRAEPVSPGNTVTPLRGGGRRLTPRKWDDDEKGAVPQGLHDQYTNVKFQPLSWDDFAEQKRLMERMNSQFATMQRRLSTRSGSASLRQSERVSVSPEEMGAQGSRSAGGAQGAEVVGAVSSSALSARESSSEEDSRAERAEGGTGSVPTETGQDQDRSDEMGQEEGAIGPTKRRDEERCSDDCNEPEAKRVKLNSEAEPKPTDITMHDKDHNVVEEGIDGVFDLVLGSVNPHAAPHSAICL